MPLVPFLTAAERAGDDVLVIGPPAMEDAAGRLGFPFRAGGEPDESAVGHIRERLPLAPPAEAARLANRDLFGRLATEALLPAMDDACRSWRPDLVLREPCEYASALVAGARGLAIAQVAISRGEVELGSIDAAGPVLDSYRPGLAGELRAMTYLSRFPASLDPTVFGATVRYHDPPAPGRALPDWWDGRDGPLVYVTFGTVLGYMSIAAEVYGAVLEAVSGVLGARVLITVGTRFDTSALGPIPDSVHVETWVDQRDVLAEAAVVVCHGGAGTVLGALAAGVPMVVVPVFADQSANARLAVDAGAAQVVRRESEPDGGGPVIAQKDVPRITDAILALLGDASYGTAARRVARELGRTPSAGEVLERLRAEA
jgi:Glycosyltransferase family 28 C-terminal domain